ncbi:aminotransferase class IV [Apibacter raozihei]|uniref:aminotransferase class IV n=1 Tax=Apibacter TaxID=1778601 RepID=UPI000FE31452|nr:MULTISPECIES: aminotransferase class IV [Apibacter]
MKVIFNGSIVEEKDLIVNYTQKNFFTGDFVNGFCWFFQNKILFWEDVYFQLMASMRKMRINIPLSFTPEMFEKEIMILSDHLHTSQGRIKLTVFRNQIPENAPDVIIEFLPYKDFYNTKGLELDVYKEIQIFPTLLSALYIYHPVNIVAEQYAYENELQELILLNQDKRIARSIFGNLFLIQDNLIVSNSTQEGAYLSVLKKNFITFLREKTEYIYKEENLSPFQTQSAQEIFILSEEHGFIPVKKVRKSNFKNEISHLLSKKFTGYALEVSRK